MTKVAVFCEGETELRFCRRLFPEVLGNTCLVQSERLWGKTGNYFLETRYQQIVDGHEYLVRIIDCGGGGSEAVVSQVLELHKKFITQHDYDFIIGIRDVFPLSRDRIDALKENFRKRVPENPIPSNPARVFLILSVMEIEAWFLAEHTHFRRIAPELSVKLIAERLKFNPAEDDMQLRERPASDLAQIYEFARRNYDIPQTVNALDMNRVYLELPQRYPPLYELIQIVELIHSAKARP